MEAQIPGGLFETGFHPGSAERCQQKTFFCPRKGDQKVILISTYLPQEAESVFNSSFAIEHVIDIRGMDEQVFQMRTDDGMDRRRRAVFLLCLQKGERKKQISDLIEMDDAYFLKCHNPDEK